MQPFKRYIYLSLALFILLFSAAWMFSSKGRQYFTFFHVGVYGAKFEMLRNCDIGKILILGDSRTGMAYDPAVLGGSVKSYAFTGHTPIEGYFFAKKLLACPNKPAGVILAYSPKELSDLQWFWSVAVPSGILDMDELSEITDTARKLGDHEIYRQQFGTELPPLAKNWTYLHHLPVYDFPTFMALKYKLNLNIYNQNAAIYRQEMDENGFVIFPGNNVCIKGLSPESEAPRLKTNKVIDFYYRKLIDMLEAQHIKTIIAPIPYSTKSYDLIAPAFKSDLLEYQRSVIRGKQYVSLHKDLFTEVDNCLFADDLHVNRQGAAAFSELMKQDLMPQFARPAPLAKGSSR